MSNREAIQVCVEVKFMPYPSEDDKREAYLTHAKLFLRVKERELLEKPK